MSKAKLKTIKIKQGFIVNVRKSDVNYADEPYALNGAKVGKYTERLDAMGIDYEVIDYVDY